jgi:hypothetical protein
MKSQFLTAEKYGQKTLVSLQKKPKCSARTCDTKNYLGDTGMQECNSFLEFGQICGTNALCKATGASNGSEGLLHLFRELHGQLLKDFVIFFHGLLQAISNNLPDNSKELRARLSANSPALFVHFNTR